MAQKCEQHQGIQPEIVVIILSETKAAAFRLILRTIVFHQPAGQVSHLAYCQFIPVRTRGRSE